MDKITDDKLNKYFSITEQALAMAKDSVNEEMEEAAAIILDMASRYFSDAGHFRKNGDKVTAFASLNYAHGWLDSGAMLGIFKVNDNRLFTVDGEE